MIKRMIWGDFNPYHDAANGRFTFANAVGAVAPLRGKSENGERLLQGYKEKHNGKKAENGAEAQKAVGKYSATKFDDVAKKLSDLNSQADNLYRIGKDWYDKETDKAISQSDVDSLFDSIKKTKQEWRDLVDAASDPSGITAKDMAHKVLILSENEIRNDKTETGFLVNAKGEPILRKSDNKADEVNFAGYDLTLFADGLFTHNHPSGSTFSWQDVDFAFKLGLSEVRACNKSGAYSLRRDFEIGDAIPSKYIDFATDYKNYYNRAKKAAVSKLELRKITLNEANDMLKENASSWLSKNAASYGWKYTEEMI